jgi:hypothetical protein
MDVAVQSRSEPSGPSAASRSHRPASASKKGRLSIAPTSTAVHGEIGSGTVLWQQLYPEHLHILVHEGSL